VTWIEFKVNIFCTLGLSPTDRVVLHYNIAADLSRLGEDLDDDVAAYDDGELVVPSKLPKKRKQRQPPPQQRHQQHTSLHPTQQQQQPQQQVLPQQPHQLHEHLQEQQQQQQPWMSHLLFPSMTVGGYPFTGFDWQSGFEQSEPK
jgi:hypothetical protein